MRASRAKRRRARSSSPRWRGEHLDRDGAVEQLVVGLPDARHPAVRDVADHPVAVGQRDARGRLWHPSTVPTGPCPLCFPPAMARICHSCGKRPAFGQSRSHSMVATKRRFDANLQKVRISEAGAPEARLRLHPLPQGGQGHQGVAGRPPWPIRASSASAASSSVRWPSWKHAARRSTTSTSSRSPTATRATTWRSRCAPCSTSSTASPARARSTRSAATRSSTRVARAALLGARGNSGVILSQLIRGAAEELASRPGELVDPVLIGAAMARAADRAYDSVREPAEGTILTVVREMAHRVASELAHMDAAAARAGRRRRAPGRADRRGARAGARRRPELGPARPRPAAVLREAGVVDAGGFGLTVIFAGVVAALRGTEAPELDHHAPARVTHPQHESSTFRYCTNFAVTGEALDPTAWIEALEAIGDSVLVVGDQRTLKVHVHTDEPERATGAVRRRRLGLAPRRGRHARAGPAAHRAAPPSRPRRCGVVAVVAGKGMEELFTSLGATPLPGGPTLNPSTYELLAGIHDVPAEEVVVLPNSPNVLMAAERAAELSEKKVFVVPTRSQQAGLAAAVALDPDARRRRERRGDARRARAGAHRRRHRGGARRRRGPPGALPPRRRGRLHRRADRRLGRAGRDARGRARRAGPRGRAA